MPHDDDDDADDDFTRLVPKGRVPVDVSMMDPVSVMMMLSFRPVLKPRATCHLWTPKASVT